MRVTGIVMAWSGCSRPGRPSACPRCPLRPLLMASPWRLRLGQVRERCNAVLITRVRIRVWKSNASTSIICIAPGAVYNQHDWICITAILRCAMH